MAVSKPQHFNSQMEIVGKFGYNIEYESMKNEPMFFNSDLEYAYNNGGKITRSFIENLPEEWRKDKVVFDSRVHMLMPGWFPAIPGYHHDDVPRPTIPVGQHFATAGQPDYDNPRYHAEHILGLLNADVCPTAFAIGECDMPAVPENDIIYRVWHLEVMKLIEEGKLSQVLANSGELIKFDWQTFHTGQKAVKNGWRWFGRVSRNTDRVNTITNEIRRQVQVYMEYPMQGW